MILITLEEDYFGLNQRKAHMITITKCYTKLKAIPLINFEYKDLTKLMIPFSSKILSRC